MLPHTATRNGWNSSFGLSSKRSPSARHASCSASASQATPSSASTPRQARKASSARAPSFFSTLLTLFSSSSRTSGPQNMKASLPAASSRRVRRSATRG